MRKLYKYCFLVGLLLASCNSQHLIITETSEPVPATTIPQKQEETNIPDCTDNIINPIGQSIAEDFDTVNYQQVITWFCNGAEFEDILVALETEAQTDTSAEDMLEMLANGMNWDEIWQFVELTD